MLELTAETFEEEVLKADGYVFVDYYSADCIPCKALLPKIEELEIQYADSFKFTALDTSKEYRLALKQKVLGAPTLAIYKDGKKIHELMGAGATAENIGELLCELSG